MSITAGSLPRNPGHADRFLTPAVRGPELDPPVLPAARATPDGEAAELEAALAAAGSEHRSPLARLRGASDQRQERRVARRLAARDPQGLAELHELTARAAFAVIVAIVRDRGHAEDVHQQVYAEVWQRAGQFDPARGSLITWVLTIARSRSIDHLRRRSEQPTEADLLVSLGGAGVDQAFQDVVDRAYVAEALHRLPQQERDVLRLRFWEGLSQTEIAERTGQPLGTVKSRMLSGLRTLRQHLEAEGSP